MSAPTMPARVWPGDEPPTPPHPAPEVPCRLATDDEIPRGARPVLRLAEAHGWSVTATYARGTKPGRAPRVVDSLALRMRRDFDRAAAVWLDGRTDCALVWQACKTPRVVKLAELRELLATPVGATVGGEQ